MDFFAVILFVILYHLRPHEWIGAAATLRPAMLTMLLALYGTATREKGFSFSLLLRTPHDWLMLAYLIWMVGTSPTPLQTWKDCYSLFLYYFVITLSLSSIERMRVLIRWWALMLVLIAGLAVASEYGFDPMYSYDLTHGQMKGRLVLNTSIFDNPNALGHSVIPAIAMLYFLFWWKRFFTFKALFLPLAALCAYCTFLTVSKGAYLSAFATWVASYMFRRPIAVQVLVVVLALTAGVTAIKTLPRMNELQAPQADGGIQGRVMVFTWGYSVLQRNFHGVGWGNFQNTFEERYRFKKPAHSSYVSIGTELGWPGLMLFVGIIFCGFKTLFLAKTRDDEEERVRRLLFVLLVSYSASSWMVGWEARANFFIMLAVTSAFHRHLLGMNEPKVENIEATENSSTARPTLDMTTKTTVATFHRRDEIQSSVPSSKEEVTEANAADEAHFIPGIKWNRLGWKDAVGILLMTYIVIRVWNYAIQVI